MDHVVASTLNEDGKLIEKLLSPEALAKASPETRQSLKAHEEFGVNMDATLAGYIKDGLVSAVAALPDNVDLSDLDPNSIRHGLNNVINNCTPDVPMM